MTASPRHCATDSRKNLLRRDAVRKSLPLVAGLLIAALGQGECFADVVLTSVNLSGTVTLADAYREQTLGRSVGTGLAGSYAGAYSRSIGEGYDSGWVFGWQGGPSEDPWGPAGSSQLGVSLSSVYQSAFPAPGVTEELYGSLSIDLVNTRANSSSPSHIYPKSLSFPEAAPDRSNVRMAASLQVNLLGTADRAFDANASITLGLESDEPLLRVFMTDEAFQIIYDTGPLDSVISSPIISQTLTYNSFVGSGIDDFYVYTITPVPEPSTWVMAVCGLAFAAWRALRRDAARKSPLLLAALLIAALGQGKCFAGMVLTSVNLSGTVTVGPDAYRSAQTVTGSAGTGLQGSYNGWYSRLVNDGDSGWIFEWAYGPVETPWGPHGSSQLNVALKSLYEEVSGTTVEVKEELSGGLLIDLKNMEGAGGYSGPLSFPEATPDRSNVMYAAVAEVALSGMADRAFDADASITFGLQSDEPLLRVFMTDDNDAIAYDSRPLGGVMTSPIISRTWTYDSLVGSDYDRVYVYTITAVPEPSTDAMGLAGLACGGFSAWRRRHRVGA